jgi:hypothetical protein
MSYDFTFSAVSRIQIKATDPEKARSIENRRKKIKSKQPRPVGGKIKKSLLLSSVFSCIFLAVIQRPDQRERRK